MTKDVKITLYTNQTLADGSNQDITISARGRYYYKGKRHHLIYDYIDDGLGSNIHDYIKVQEDLIEIKRSGAINSKLIYDIAKKSIAKYSNPYLTFDLAIDTHDIRIEQKNNLIKVLIDYSQDINKEYFCRANLQIIIEPDI